MQCGKHPATSIGAGHGTRSFTSSRCFGCNENKRLLMSKGHELDNFSKKSTKYPMDYPDAQEIDMGAASKIILMGGLSFPNLTGAKQ